MGDIDGGLARLDEAMATARKVGRLDEIMRCYANRTTLLDLDSRREEALAVVKEGIAEASRSGLGLTYGAFLRGNAADILFQLGRWAESEAECRAAMEFPPAGVAWFSPTLYLGLVLVESRADEETSRLVGQTLLQLETVPAGQWSALVLRTAVSDALWRGELADARNAAEQGWQRVQETDDPRQIAYAASTVLEACAASAERGRTASATGPRSPTPASSPDACCRPPRRQVAASGNCRVPSAHGARPSCTWPRRVRTRGPGAWRDHVGDVGRPRRGVGQGADPVPGGQGALVAGAGGAARSAPSAPRPARR